MLEMQMQAVVGSRPAKTTIGIKPVRTNNPGENSIVTGRALDAAVAEAVLGWRFYDHGTSDRERRTLAPPGWAAGALRQDYDLIPLFSADIAAAWMVVEALAERGWRMRLTSGSGRDTLWHCAFAWPGASPGEGRKTGADADLGRSGRTAPEAVCRAALAVAAFSSSREDAEAGRQVEPGDVPGDVGGEHS